MDKKLSPMAVYSEMNAQSFHSTSKKFKKIKL